MKLFYSLLFTIILYCNCSGQSTFINEVNYLATTNCLEMITPEGTDITNWRIHAYKESGEVNGSQDVTGTIFSTVSGFDIIIVDVIIFFETNGGIFLENAAENVTQFISFGTPITGVDGPAQGLTSENIGAQTVDTNPLQLEGTGTVYTDFTWTDLYLNSCGSVNSNQILTSTEEVLPVELVHFTAREKDQMVYLTWETLTEINSDYFLLEKSQNGRDWSILAHLDGSLESNQSIVYDYIDRRPFIGTNYYRLSQYDLDGSLEVFDIVSAETHAADEIQLFPNPAENELYINLPLGDSYTDYEISIYNMLGVKMDVKISDTGTSRIDLSQLKSGTYYLNVVSGRNEYQLIFVKI